MDNQVYGLIKFDQIVPNGRISFEFKPEQELIIKIQVIYQNWVYTIENTFLKERLTNFKALPIQSNPSLLFTTCMEIKLIPKNQIKLCGIDEKKPRKSLVLSRKENFDSTSSSFARSDSSSISPENTARELAEKNDKLIKTLGGSSISKSTSNLDDQPKTREIRKNSNCEKRKSKDSKRNSKNLTNDIDLKNNINSAVIKSSSGSSDSKSSSYVSPRRTLEDSSHELVKSSLDLEKNFKIENKTPLIESKTPLLVFGKKEWEDCIGKLDENSHFPLPFDVLKIQDVVSPFWEEMTYGETNMLLLIPAFVNKIGLSRKYFEELTSKNKLKSINYSFHCSMSNYDEKVAKSYWVFITKHPVPETLKLSHNNSLKFIAKKIDLYKDSVEFINNIEMPTFIEVGLANIVAGISKINLYKNITTRCQEKVQNDTNTDAHITMGNSYGELTVRNSAKQSEIQGQTIVTRFLI